MGTFFELYDFFVHLLVLESFSLIVTGGYQFVKQNSIASLAIINTLIYFADAYWLERVLIVWINDNRYKILCNFPIIFFIFLYIFLLFYRVLKYTHIVWEAGNNQFIFGQYHLSDSRVHHFHNFLALVVCP